MKHDYVFSLKDQLDVYWRGCMDSLFTSYLGEFWYNFGYKGLNDKYNTWWMWLSVENNGSITCMLNYDL